jgi:hypothetical protein
MNRRDDFHYVIISWHVHSRHLCALPQCVQYMNDWTKLIQMKTGGVDITTHGLKALRSKSEDQERIGSKSDLDAGGSTGIQK